MTDEPCGEGFVKFSHPSHWACRLPSWIHSLLTLSYLHNAKRRILPMQSTHT